MNYELDENPSVEAMNRVLDGVRSFNQAATRLPRPRPIATFLRDETGTIVGGIRGDLWGQSLHVAAVWVDDRYRHQGHATVLLRMLEERAVALGARLVYLETASFQARPFYERQGYRVFGQLDGIADGCTLFFMRKDLAPPAIP